MSSVAGSSLGISPLSKQQASVLPENMSNASKAMKLRQMIEELEKERREYLKTNQHLVENTKSIYQQNKALKDAIIDRTTYYENILDRYSQSEQTLKTASERSKKMAKVYHGYKNKAKNDQKTSESDFCPEEIFKFEQELDDIQKSANDLFNKFYESEKRIYDYKVLLSLDSRLTRINKVLTCEAKNQITTHPELIESENLNKLQQKVEKGDEIKKELSLLDDQDDEDDRMATTEKALKKFSDKLDRCIQIYNNLLLINRKRALMEEEDLDYSSLDENSMHSSQKSNKVKFQSVESKVPKNFGLDVEISELRRIVGIDGFGYLNDSERERNHRKIKNYFVHNKSDFDSESEKLNKKIDDKSKRSETVEDDDKNSKSRHHSEKVKSRHSRRVKNNDKNLKQDNSEKVDTSEDKQHKKHHSKKNNEKEDSLLSVKNLNKLLVQPNEEEEQSEKVDTNDKFNHTEKVDNSEEKKKTKHHSKKNNEKEEPSLSVKNLNKLLVQPNEEEEQSEKVNKNDKNNHTEKDDNSEEKQHTKHHSKKNNEKEEPSLSVKNLNKLLVQPNEEEEQSEKVDKNDKNNHPEKDDNSEKTKQSKDDEMKTLDKSQHQLSGQPAKQPEKDEYDDKSLKSNHLLEKANNTESYEKYSDKSVQTEMPFYPDDNDQNLIFHSEKGEQTKLSVDPLKSLLVHPNKDRQKPTKKHTQKVNEEEERESEFILSEEQSEITRNSENSTHSNQPDTNTKPNPPEKPQIQQKQDKDKSNSLLVYPDKSRQKSKTKTNTQTEEEERVSEYILLEESGLTTQSENPIQPIEPDTDADTKPKPPEKPQIQQKQEKDKSNSLLVYPDKSRQKSRTKTNTQTEEEERVSEYILLEESGLTTQSENPVQPIEPDTNTNTKPKPPEKPQPQEKQDKDKSNSLLVYPDKSRQKSNTKRNTRATEEENISEYILLEESGLTTQSENPIQPIQPETNTHTKPKPPEKPQPQEKQDKDKSNSLLVYPDKSRQRSNTKRNTRATEEEENISEYILLEESEITNNSDHLVKSKKPEKVNISVQTNISRQNDKIKQPKQQDKSNSLLVYPDKNRQKSNTNNNVKLTDEDERISEYILLDESDITSKSENPIQSNQPDTNTKPKPPEKPQPQQKQDNNKSNSLLVYPDKNRQRSNTNYNAKLFEEEERVSEYILLDESGITSQSENHVQFHQPDINIKIKQQVKTQTEEKQDNNKSNSLLVYPDKNRQKSNTNYNAKLFEEEERVSEYILLEESEVSCKSENPIQSIQPITNTKPVPPKPPQTQQKQDNNKSNSLLIYPDKNRQRSCTKNNTKISEEEQISEFILLDESEITNNSDQLIKSQQQQQENPTKPEQITKTKLQVKLPQQKPINNKSNSLLIYPDKTRQRSFTKNNVRISDEEQISEFILLDESEVTNNSDHLFKPQQQPTENPTQLDQITTTKPTQKPNNNNTNSNSLLIYPDKNRHQPPSHFFRGPTFEEDFDSEYLLLDEEHSEPEPPQTDTKRIQTDETTVKQQVHLPKTQRTKPARKSTYDPSIFYTSSISFSTLKKSSFERCNEQVPLTVSLKDIGLEGLDSATFDKTQQLKRLNEEEKNASKSRGKSANDDDDKIESINKPDYVCKLVIFGSPSSSQKKRTLSKSRKIEYSTFSTDAQKTASLLDSTQKAQKCQAIKPKVGQKMNKSASGSLNGSFDGETKNEFLVNAQVNRSPRRYSNNLCDSIE